MRKIIIILLFSLVLVACDQCPPNNPKCLIVPPPVPELELPDLPAPPQPSKPDAEPELPISPVPLPTTQPEFEDGPDILEFLGLD